MGKKSFIDVIGNENVAVATFVSLKIEYCFFVFLISLKAWPPFFQSDWLSHLTDYRLKNCTKSKSAYKFITFFSEMRKNITARKKTDTYTQTVSFKNRKTIGKMKRNWSMKYYIYIERYTIAILMANQISHECYYFYHRLLLPSVSLRSLYLLSVCLHETISSSMSLLLFIALKFLLVSLHHHIQLVPLNFYCAMMSYWAVNQFNIERVKRFSFFYTSWVLWLVVQRSFTGVSIKWCQKDVLCMSIYVLTSFRISFHRT